MAIGNAIGIGIPMVNLGLGGGGGESFLLDDYPNTSTGTVDPSAVQGVSYSLRNLFSTYTGNVVTVRRASDDATNDFTASEVEDGTMVSWVNAEGTTSGHVKTWFDQNGNYDLTQITPSQQPIIVTLAGLVTVNGKAAIDFDQGIGDAKALKNTSLYPSPLTQPELYNIFAVNRLKANGSDDRTVYNLSSSGNNTFSINSEEVTLEGKAANISVSISPTYIDNQTLYQTTSGGRRAGITANKNLIQQGNISSTFVTQFSLGLPFPASLLDNSPSMKAQEFVFYPFGARFPSNTFTADEVSDAINSYYGIF